MENVNNLEFPNKYVQGSIWKWVRKEFNKNLSAGVQSSERPVLIISNNTFNASAPAVNCITITSTLRESPVHEPIYITMDSHLQCEQVHTVNKEELTEYKGMASKTTLSNVKAKLRIQFSLSEDRNTELFNRILKMLEEMNESTVKRFKAIDVSNEKADKELELLNVLNGKIDTKVSYNINNVKDIVNALLQKANKGFGVPDLENEVIKILTASQSSYEKIKEEVELLKNVIIKWGNNQSNSAIPKIDINALDNGIKQGTKTDKRGRGKQRNYTEEDKKFIADDSNSYDELMQKYDYTKTQAYKMRLYFKKYFLDTEKSGNTDFKENKKGKNSKEKNLHRNYTNEDKKFILDTNNSIDVIAEKYGFKNKNAVYNARAYIKKTYEKS